MAMHKNHMRSIVRRNGHLVVEGDETSEELRMALTFLRRHTIDKCHAPHMGMPIEALIPDTSVLAVKSTKSARATVDIRSERL